MISRNEKKFIRESLYHSIYSLCLGNDGIISNIIISKYVFILCTDNKMTFKQFRRYAKLLDKCLLYYDREVISFKGC